MIDRISVQVGDTVFLTLTDCGVEKATVTDLSEQSFLYVQRWGKRPKAGSKQEYVQETRVWATESEACDELASRCRDNAERMLEQAARWAARASASRTDLIQAAN